MRRKRLEPNLADVINIDVKHRQNVATFPAILTGFFSIAGIFWRLKAKEDLIWVGWKTGLPNPVFHPTHVRFY